MIKCFVESIFLCLFYKRYYFCQNNLDLFSKQVKSSYDKKLTKKINTEYSVGSCEFKTHLNIKHGEIINDEMIPQLIDANEDSYIEIIDRNGSKKLPFIQVFKKTEELCGEAVLSSLLAPKSLKLMMKGVVNITNQTHFSIFRQYRAKPATATTQQAQPTIQPQTGSN